MTLEDHKELNKKLSEPAVWAFLLGGVIAGLASSVTFFAIMLAIITLYLIGLFIYAGYIDIREIRKLKDEDKERKV